MILLVTPLARTQECTLAIEEATGEPVKVCTDLPSATLQLEAQVCRAVVFDQLLLDAEAEQAESVLKHLGSAVPVYLNFAVCGIPRLVRELRLSLQRRKRELVAAREEAEQTLLHEMRETVTALLLSCEMALQVPNLPPLAQNKLQTADALARDLSMKLGAMA
jgi:hypothetical protein